MAISFAAETLRLVTSLPVPDRNPETSSTDPTVAESPILWNSPATPTSLSRPTESCAPRSSSASSCISSTTTCRTLARCLLRFLPVKSTCRVSGVVIMTSGGDFDCAVLSDCVVSPCRTATFTPTDAPISFSRLSRSLLSALRGVTYRHLIPGPVSLASTVSIGSIAASVLPIPVGATKSRCLPDRIEGIAFL